MLQFSGTFGITTIRCVPQSWRLTALLSTTSISNSDAVSNLTKVNINTINNNETSKEKLDTMENKTEWIKESSDKQIEKKFKNIKASLMSTFPGNNLVVQKIKLANSVSDLLNIASLPGIGTESVVKIISTVTKYTQVQEPNNSNDIKLSSIQPGRFISKKETKNISAEFLRFIKSPEDIALLSNLSIDQLIQVLSSLRLKRNRDTPVLREVANNINRSDVVLNIKQSADVLYSMAVLNFPDEDLLQKVASDLLITIPLNQQMFVFNSILASIGRLHYRNEKLLAALCKWTLENRSLLKTENLSTFLQTLAAVGFKNEDAILFINEEIYPLKDSDMTGITEWIDWVWSLTVLDEVQQHHITSVLDKNFIDKFLDIQRHVPKLIKLLNINAVAKMIIKDYRGSFLEQNSRVFSVPMKRSKDKDMAVTVLAETLRNVFPSTSYFKTNIDLGMGFLIDAECALDRNFNPIPVENTNLDCIKIAIIKYGYHDYCRGDRKLLGLVQLQERLLQAAGYKILAIPYDIFNKKDKLAERIQYISENLKIVAKESLS